MPPSDSDMINVDGASDGWGLADKRILVTGGASGIGAATARLAAADGAVVTIVDLPGSNGAAMADEMGATFVPGDVSSAESWAGIANGLDGLDIAILNAGVEFRPPTAFSTFDDPGAWDLDLYRRAVGVNIDGVALGIHSLVPVIDKSGGGSISATASLAGLIPWSPDPVYSMTKWAVVGLIRALATPLKAMQIQINCVCPGGVATPMTRVTDGSVPKGMAAPEHIARAHLQIATSGQTGRAIKAVAGYEHEAHQFARVEGTF